MNITAALNLLGGETSDLLRVVMNGFGTYTIDYSKHADVHSKAARSIIRHDHVIDFARRNLPSDRYRLVNLQRRKMFAFNEKVLVQFKKLGPNLRPSNARTKQSAQIEQQGQLELPGLDFSMPILTVGYVPDRSDTSVAGVFLTYSDHTQHWVYQISDDGQGNLFNITPIAPVPLDAHESVPQKPRIRLKGDRRPADPERRTG